MQWQQAIVRVWDGLPHRNGRFAGTAFFIDPRTLLTARHVVENCNDNVYIDGVPLGGKEKIEADNIYLCNRDIAILRTNRAFPDIVPLCLNNTELNNGQIVTLNGYFDELQSLNVIKSEITGHVSFIHTWRTQGSISRGMSGGPVVLNNENKLIGLLQAKDADKNLTYLIPTDVILDCLRQSGIQETTHKVFRYNVPSLPRHYIPRNEHFNRIKALLLKSETRNVGITGVSRAVGLQGMGGIGKSILATAIAHDNQIQNAFHDGIIWIKLGQTTDNANIVNTQNYILECLDELVTNLQTPQQGKALLNKLLADKKILLILDDIWDIKQARAFDISATSSKLLITTRHTKVLKALDAEKYQIGVLSNEQALQLLRNQSEYTQEVMPEEAQQIIKECGFLPLAISMVGAMLRNRPRSRWQRVLKHLQSADLQKIHHPLRDYEHIDLLKALHVSVESQPSLIQQCYLSLVVFPEDIPIPESVLGIYWDQDDLQHYDALDIIDELLDASLVFRYQEDSVTLHDLQRAYLCCQSTNLKQLHEKMINAYAKSYPGGWHTIPVRYPYYFHNHFDFHLNQVGNKKQAQTIAEDLHAKQPLLGWTQAVKCAKLAKITIKQVASQLIKTNKAPSTLVNCLKILGTVAKEDARSLLNQENQHPYVIASCLKLLGEDAKEQARSLLNKENQHYSVIVSCLRLLGEDAKEQARSLLNKENQHPYVISACLQLLGEYAKEEARSLLKKHQNSDVLIACLQLLGEDAKEEAQSLLKKHQNPDVLIACLQLLGEYAKENARSLLNQEHQHHYVIASCLRLLGEDAKEEARSLLKKNQNPDVLIACLQLLGEDVKEEARSLLKKHQNPDVLIACLQLLGEDAKEEARSLLNQEHQHTYVIASCLKLLGEDAKEDARSLLNQENQDPDVTVVCLSILGKDAANFALEKLRGKNWRRLHSSVKAAILNIPLNKPIRQKRAIEVLSKWYRYNRIIVTAALKVFNDHPEKVMVYCQKIITQWEHDITYCIQKGFSKYSFHITKALRHPGLYNVAQQAASEMLLKEKEHPGFLDDGLRELAQKISNGEMLSWDQDFDETTDQ